MSSFDRAAWEAEIAEFRRRRDEALRAPDGWLSVVSLDWLEEGDNAVHSGRAQRRGDEVTVSLAGVEGTLTVKAGSRGTLGGRVFEAMWRGGLLGLRERDPAAPARASFPGVESYAPSPAWRLEGRFQRYERPGEVELELATGGTSRFAVPGLVTFFVDGREHSLEPVQESGPGARVQFIFGDASNRDDTYPAGRFLYVPIPDGEHLIVDFNKALNPPCAFTEHATCPFPAPQNRLPVRVEAGERRLHV